MSDRLLVGSRKGLFTLRRGARGWAIDHLDFSGVPVGMTLADPRDGWLYAALNHGHFGVKMHRSGNGGETWEECAVPTYPAAAEGETKAPALMQVWALETGGADQPDLLWAGTIPGGLFTSRDRGSSWELVRGLWDRPERAHWFGGGAEEPGINSICVDPRDSRRVAVAVSCGGVWVTEDGGDTWACRATGMWADYMPPEGREDPNIQDIHRLAQCSGAPDVMWAQHHSGMFRTTDGAVSWQEITDVRPSQYGFPVAAHPTQADTAWFVPMRSTEERMSAGGQLVVNRTRDGGRTFDTLRDGLPLEHAYDLVFRHALDVDGTGERLAFGSTTGNLWLSENGGDSWQTLSTHLPPVYSVRFG